jgi:SPP1 gp7 family putative phage head morphogenesis protein
LDAYEQTIGRLTIDAASDPLKEAIEALAGLSQSVVLSLSPDIQRWTVRAQDWHREMFASRAKEGTGVDVNLYILPSDAQNVIAAYQDWSTGLIRGANDDVRRKVEGIVYSGVTRQTPRREVARELAAAMGVNRRRALIIATDQALKLTSRLDQLRQQDAGIDTYMWRHSGKLNPREWHVEREGKVFKWDEPPYDGHPGTLVNCGCKAQAYIDLE